MDLQVNLQGLLELGTPDLGGVAGGLGRQADCPGR